MNKSHNNSGVQRYSFWEYSELDGVMADEDPDGDYVTYKDYRKMEQERDWFIAAFHTVCEEFGGREMNKPHKYADVIRHWAEGGDIEYMIDNNDIWIDWNYFHRNSDSQPFISSSPLFNDERLKWRIKPE